MREFATVDDVDADALLVRAHAAYIAWRAVPIARRVELFQTMANLVTENIEDLARQVSLEMGKPLNQARLEVSTAVEIFRYHAENGPPLLADRELAVPGFARAFTGPEPIGVVLGIQPWNGPIYQAVRVAAPNLMLGNTVLLKPAEISAGSTLRLDRLFEDAGFPAHVYQTSLVSTAQVSTYLADPRVRAVTLTGSDRAGSAIGEQAGRNIKPAVLELGGSDAFIVLDSADVSTAAAMSSVCRLAIGGQICVSPKRIIVTDAVADDFIAQFIESFANQKLGDPFAPDTTVGPMSSEAAADGLQAQYQDAVDKGATVLVPGGRVEGPGAFFAPAVITEITPEMRVFTEEHLDRLR